jgi:hypothetical protein
MANPTDLEIGWVAGIIDGEGHFAIKKSLLHGRYLGFTAHLNVSNTNRAILERFAKIVGFGTIYKRTYRDSKRKPCFIWDAHGYHAVVVCRLVLAHLVKREQAELLLEAAALIPPRGRAGRGRKNRDHPRLLRLHQRLKAMTRRGPKSEDLDAADIEVAQLELLRDV